jgi:hypothetical protein
MSLGIAPYYKKDMGSCIFMSNKFLINISDSERENGCTKTSIKYKKDCCDFTPLRDGTILGDHRYCDLSLVCQQVDVLPNGKVMPMEAHILPVVDLNTGEVVEHHMFCTGMHDLRPLTERTEDDKVS